MELEFRRRERGNVALLRDHTLYCASKLEICGYLVAWKRVKTENTEIGGLALADTVE